PFRRRLGWGILLNRGDECNPDRLATRRRRVGVPGRVCDASLNSGCMDLATFRQLLTDEGRAALAAATDLTPTAATTLAALDRLRKRFDPDLARAAVETVL